MLSLVVKLIRIKIIILWNNFKNFIGLNDLTQSKINKPIEPKEMGLNIMVNQDNLIKYHILLNNKTKNTEVEDCAKTIKQIIEPCGGSIIQTMPSFQMILLKTTKETIEEIKKLPFVISISK